jgi:hypothetical protein
MSELLKREVKIPISILSFHNLNPEKPRLNELNTDRVVHEWTADFLLDPKTKGFERCKGELDSLYGEFLKKHGNKVPAHFPKFETMGEWQNQEKGKKNPLHIVGMECLRTAQQKEGKEYDFSPPQLLGPDGTPINFSNFYSGCYVRGVIMVREYEYKKNGNVLSRGLTSDLRAVQFIRDGEPLGSGSKDYTSYLVDSVDDDEEEMVRPENRAYVPQAASRFAI